MRALFVLLAPFLAITVMSGAWTELDHWDTAEPEHGFGLAWRADEIYIANWHPEEPWDTNLYVYDETGTYQGTHFPAGIIDIDISGIDWKGDTDHGGEGWYGGGRQEPTMYLIADDGSSYADFAGPSSFTRMYGVAHNPDNDMLYVSDFMSGWVAWGPLDGSGAVTSWTDENVSLTYSALKYVSLGRTGYLLAIYRDAGFYYHELHIFSLTGGVPNNIYSPDVTVDFEDYYYYLGDFDWDGEYMWLLDQNYDGATNLDAVAMLDIPEFTEGTVNIVPTSLGNIKAQFR